MALYIHRGKNKTETMLLEVIERLKKSKKDYLLICQDKRKVFYIDSTYNLEFLKKVQNEISRTIEDLEYEIIAQKAKGSSSI